MKSIEVDLSRHFSLQIKTLKLCGLWFFIPYSIRTFRFWLSIFIRVFLVIYVFTIPTFGQLTYVIKLILNGNAEIQVVAGILNLIMTEFLVPVRILDLFLRRDILMKLLDQLTNEEFQFHLKPQKDILEKAVILIRKLFFLLFFFCGVDIFVHVIIVPGIQKFEVLPLKMDLIWIDVNKESNFIYAFAYQVSYKPTMLATYMGLHTMSWAAMACAISQFDVLIYNFENMKDFIETKMAERQCDADTAFNEIFKECVLHHNSITRFVNTLQDVFGGQFTTTLFGNAFILCTTAVQILSIEKDKLTEIMWILAYMSIFTCITFVDCYFANKVTVKSLHVSTVVFACPWIEMSTPTKKNLIIFIETTQRPIVITAAKIVPVSLETFTRPQIVLKLLANQEPKFFLQKVIVMNWTYQCFAVMNQMKK